jgi:transposase-like protein
MKLPYSSAFKEQALVKVLSRGNRTIKSVADELNMNWHTLKNWMKDQMQDNSNVTKSAIPEKRPQDWRVEEKLLALQETHSLSPEEVNAWCRGHGLFPHHLASWKAAFCHSKISPDSEMTAKTELRYLKEENGQLKRELVRKEKALAEAAALLILQKKFRALWEGEDK